MSQYQKIQSPIPSPRCRIFIRLVLSVVVMVILGASGPVKIRAEDAIWLNADAQFEYATHCFNKKEYGSAIAEFKKFLYFFPDDPRIDEAIFHIGLSSLYTGDYQNALSRFQEIFEKYGYSGPGLSAALQIARALAAAGDYPAAAAFLNDRIQEAPGPAEADILNYHLGWLYVETGQFGRAILHFEAVKTNAPAVSQAPDIKTGLEAYARIPSKSPTVAALLSAVPGGGYLYCGRYQDAFIAWLLNSMMAWAAVESFEKDLNGLGGLISIVGAGFYAGSIYGAATAAHRYNRRQQEAFAMEMKNRFSVHLFPGGPGGPGVSWSVQYRF